MKVDSQVDFGDEVVNELHAMRDFAAKPENWYRPYGTEFQRAPGNKPGMKVQSGDYTVVFTFTAVGERVFRQMSVRRADLGMPPPFIVWTFAYHLGFKGFALNNGVVSLEVGSEHCKIAWNEREQTVVALAELDKDEQPWNVN